RPRRLAAADGCQHARPLALPADRREQRAVLHRLRAHGVDLERGAAFRPGDARRLALRRRGRREWLLAPVALCRPLPLPFVWGQYAAAAMLDAQAARDYFSAAEEDCSNFGWVSSAFAWGGGRLADGWPAVLD